MTTTPAFGYQPLDDSVIVEPFYDPDVLEYGALTLYLPDAYKDAQSHQGVVVAAGPNSPYTLGLHVIYGPYTATPFRHHDREYLHLANASIVGFTRGRHLHPPKDFALVIPAKEAEGIVRTSLLYTVQRVFDSPPRTRGTVVHTGFSEPELNPGDEVLYLPDKGKEIGWIDTVYYVLHKEHILARLRP